MFDAGFAPECPCGDGGVETRAAAGESERQGEGGAGRKDDEEGKQLN